MVFSFLSLPICLSVLSEPELVSTPYFIFVKQVPNNFGWVVLIFILIMYIVERYMDGTVNSRLLRLRKAVSRSLDVSR